MSTTPAPNLYYVVKTLATQRGHLHTRELEVLHKESDTVTFLNTAIAAGKSLEDLSVDCYQLITTGAEPSGKDVFKWVKTAKEFLESIVA